MVRASTTTAKAPESKPATRSRKKTETTPTASVQSLYAEMLATQFGGTKDPALLAKGAATHSQVGIPIPLALQYTLGCSVLPLGIVLGIDGPSMSHKTAFAYELGRRFIRHGGWLDFLVTEGKINPTYAHSIIGYDEQALMNFHPFRTVSMNDWQDQLLKLIKMNQELADKGNKELGIKAGAKYPVMFAIDSVMGANLVEMSERIGKQGFAGRDFPVNAMSLTNYLKDIANKIQAYPFMLALINHLKEKPVDPNDRYAKRESTRAGGQHLKFQSTYELTLHAVKQWVIQDKHLDGALEIENRTVRINNGKNSAGTDGRAVDVDISWRFRNIAGSQRQITKWHWDKAIVDLLMKWQDVKTASAAMSDKTAVGRKENMDRFFHIRKIPRVGYVSRTLGIDKNNAIEDAEQMGALIRKSPEATRGIQSAFGIPIGYLWEPDTDYRRTKTKADIRAAKDTEDLKQAAAANRSDLYGDQDEMSAYLGGKVLE